MSNKPSDVATDDQVVRQPYMDTAWFAGLVDEVRRSSKTAVARKLGFDRASISQICNGCGPYGSGKASPRNIELAYRRVYEQMTCPHTKAQVGIDHCRSTALRAAPTHNPLQMQQWQACQRCQYKPDGEMHKADVIVIRPSKPPKRASKATDDASKEKPQQAGIVDKVTLPLPEVGAPQIAQEYA
jgi:hypothetical protein